MCDVVLTAKQLKALEFLSFKYGNGGSMCTNDNHKFLALILANKSAEASQQYSHRITDSCQEALDRITKNDFSELRENQREIIKAMFYGEEEEK